MEWVIAPLLVAFYGGSCLYAILSLFGEGPPADVFVGDDWGAPNWPAPRDGWHDEWYPPARHRRGPAGFDWKKEGF